VHEEWSDKQNRNFICPKEDPVQTIEATGERESEYTEKGDSQPEEMQGRLMAGASNPNSRTDE
jgi:hypothetical protein